MKYKFCHIPKTGGVTLCNALDIKLRGHEVVWNTDAIFLFAFCRNPYDRLVSAFFYLSTGGRNREDRSDYRKYVKGLRFGDFITTRLERASRTQRHFRPQTYWIPNGVDFLGRTENFIRDYKRLCRIMGRKPVKLRRMNTSRHRDYRTYYTKSTAKIVEEVYAQDFAELGYEVGSFLKKQSLPVRRPS